MNGEDPLRTASLPRPSGEASFFTLMNALLRRHLIFIAVVTVVTLLAIVLTLLRGSIFTSTSRFTPSSSGGSASGLSAVAAQFGFDVGGGGPGEGVDFYAELVNSRMLLEDVVRTGFECSGAPRQEGILRGDLIELFEIRGESPRRRMQYAVRQLRDAMGVRRDVMAGLLTVTVATEYPDLSEQINRRILDLVNTFNLNQRQTQAAAERGFIEARLGEALGALESAERQLTTFLEENNQYQDSATLRAEYQRLQRRVDLRQQVHTTLAQAYEEARIAEVRDTPVITIVDAPEGSAIGRRGLIRNTILGFLAGSLLGLAVILLQEYVRRQKEDEPAEYHEFDRLRRELLSRFIPWR